LTGSLIDVVFLESDSAPVTMMLEQGRRFSKAVQEEGRSHEQGPPHIFVWSGLLAGLVSMGDKLGMANAKSLAGLQRDFEKMAKDEQLDMVKVCRCDRTYNSGHHKVLLFLHPSNWEIAKLILASMVQLGGVRKQGRPPKGNMERELEDWLGSWAKA
jgi:hypothetical protein